MVKTIVGSFENFTDAYRASADLMGAGFMATDINVLGNNLAGTAPGLYAAEARPNVQAEPGQLATGAVAGGAIGGAAGIAVSLLGLAIPGIGPVLAAGTLAAALAGAGAGAVAGGLIGGLTEMGVPEDDAQFYAEAVRRGGALITVTVDDSRTRVAEDILRRNGVIDIAKRAKVWRDAGWTGYDPNAEPFGIDQIEGERARYRSNDTTAR